MATVEAGSVVPTLLLTVTPALLPPWPPPPPTLAETPTGPLTDSVPDNAKPPLPPPPPIDCAQIPWDVLPPVRIAPVWSTWTIAPVPPSPPKPPTATEPLACDAPLSATLEPPLPPPPPTDWAKMPLEPSPCVVMSPTLVTLTVLALPPPPVKPPMLAPNAPPPVLTASVPEKPPLPPPPPIDCARMPWD